MPIPCSAGRAVLTVLLWQRVAGEHAQASPPGGVHGDTSTVRSRAVVSTAELLQRLGVSLAITALARNHGSVWSRAVPGREPVNVGSPEQVGVGAAASR